MYSTSGLEFVILDVWHNTDVYALSRAPVGTLGVFWGDLFQTLDIWFLF